MRTSILIMRWINRILMIPFVVTLLAGLVDANFLFLSFYGAFFVGVFQLFSFLIILFYLRRVEKSKKKAISIYLFSVVTYFIGLYLLVELYNSSLKNTFISVVMHIIPVLLSIFWTYILESIKQER